jgi:hypothetical protein
VLRNDASARLNEPSGSIFILEISDCKVVSFVAMAVDRDFDPLGRKEDKNVIQHDDPRERERREVTAILCTKLLKKN